MMSAQIISISSISRASLPSSHDEVLMEGFRRALRYLSDLKGVSMRETIIALENWQASGLLTQAEADALFAWHGGRRGQ